MTDNRNKTFSSVLYERADKYFAGRPSGKYASTIFFVKGLFWICLYVGCYVLFVFNNMSVLQLMLLAVVLGVCHVFIPVNMSHDAIHGAVSSKRWLNNMFGYGFDITGGNSFMYATKHLEAHYNKENGSKTTAIESQGLLLQTKDAGGSRNVHVAFYALYAQYMIFVRDFLLFFQLRKSVPAREWIKLLFFKLLYAAAFILVPFMFVKLPWWQTLTALLLMYLVVTIVLVIILLMPTDRMENAKTSGGDLPNEKWILEILEHNVDFSPASTTLNLLAGGANLNVVHYLFPAVNHVHYNKLASIIERTAIEFGLLYRKQVVTDVFGIHFRYLKNIQNANG